jgi:1A family penicillin-binding protein
MSNHRNKRSRKGKENTPGNGKGNGSSRNGTGAHPKANGLSRSHTQDESVSLLDTAPQRTIRIDPAVSPAIEEDGSGSLLEESFFSLPPKPGVLVAERPDPEIEVAISGNGHNGYEGVADDVDDVAAPAPAPVKVRVGQPYDFRPFSNGTDHLLGTNGNGVEHNGNGNGHHANGNGYHSNGSNGNGNGHYGNGNGNGSTTGSLRRARISLGRDTVVVAPGTVHPTTGHLRSADLMKARIKLGNGHAPAATMPLTVPRPLRPTTGIHARELPYFLMRHRHIRGKARVGHTRASSATKRFGSGGPFRSILLVFVAFTLLMGLVAAGGIGAGIGGAYAYLKGLPPVDKASFQAALDANGINVQTTKIYDRSGVPLYEAVDEETGRREEVKLKDISSWVISATLAAEDAEFYTNPGIDVRGIIRAVNINLTGQGSSGASTITQQLARDIFLPDEEAAVREGWAAVNRKIKEMVLAIQLTREYSKDFILETYLNQIFYGHGAYGIQAAAFVYFGKDAKDLNVEEAALVAGLPQQPTLYDPYVNPEIAKRRQELVLDLMAKQGILSPQEAEEAKLRTLVLKPYNPIIRAPHFAYYVKSYLEQTYGPEFLQGGYRVYTTLDLKVQEMAQQIAKDRVEEIKKQRASNAAIVVMKPRTGEILAMVGSVDYNDPSIDGQVNVAVAERQPGSSFKPITFATAFSRGWSPGTTILDVLTQFPGGAGQKPYVPKNYDGRDHGWVTVRESLANSYNIPAVKALQFAGIQETIDMAHAMGIKGLNRGLDYYGLSLTLGGGEVTLLDMTTAYSTFANGGLAVGANPILRIEKPDGSIFQELPSNPEGKQAMDPRIAYLISDILSDNRARTPAFGSNSALRTSFTSAAKTGTTDNNRDSWTMGYTPNLTVGVWVGNSDNAEMNRITGAIGAAVIWNKVMEDFHDNEDFVKLIQRQNPDGTLAELQEEFEQPEGIVRASACSARGGVTDLFLTDNRPGRNCVTHRDPKTNVLLHSLPGENQPRSQPRQNPQTQQRQPQRRAEPTPKPKPTPIPGIFPWTP